MLRRMPMSYAVNGFPWLGCVSVRCVLVCGAVCRRRRRASACMLLTTDGLHALLALDALDRAQRQRFQEHAQAAAAGDEEAQVSLPSLPPLPYSLTPSHHLPPHSLPSPHSLLSPLPSLLCSLPPPSRTTRSLAPHITDTRSRQRKRTFQ